MSASTLTVEGPITTSVPVEAGAGAGVAVARRHRLAPLLAMLAGLVALVAAGTVVTHAAAGAHEVPSPAHPAAPAPAPADPLAITLSARDVSVVTQVYEPGQDSGWHTHPGIHAVAVLSGVLTVYDAQCRPQTFEPGRPYVGGQELHLARNETGSPVQMTVTYLRPSAPTASTTHLAPPAGCTIGQPA